ncbi:ATP-binding protein [Petrocella sp. FN5]|uniref:ATP-binding protein n=1 Tax=Petrocella sp. FN5 TaxID=3032002 RepID=UPI0023DCD6A0|nr:ATP-binding protein [Petrocella sp. FN5]MDF1617608.1 ATP-binding protein [Petrocella sp. FN5]
MFVGRKNELDYLNTKYTSSNAEFIILYGRRRIGKTEILREFVKDKKHVFYSGHQITDFMQLNRVTGVLTEHFNKKIYSDSFNQWEQVFSYISENLTKEEKTVIVFDEFPYMVEGNSSIPSVLQSIWDHSLSKKNILIILCGSSISFMKNELLSEKNPLYGRTTGVLKITEMDFESSLGFYPNIDFHEQVAFYSVFSGVPYYLSRINREKSLKENIITSILQNGSVLFNEVEFLLKQELREVSVYNTIITAIALGRTKQNEIVQLSGVEKTKLTYYLNSLIDLGIIRKEFPSTIKTKEMVKSRVGLYILDNSFFRFYYRFVYPHVSELMDGNIDIIYEDIIEKQLMDFIGYEFEKIAIAHVRNINQRKEIPLRLIRIGRWWDKNKEIDIVGYDISHNFIFGECKWRNEKLGVPVLKQLQDKSMAIKEEVRDKYYILFSKSGFTDELKNLALIDDKIILVDYNLAKGGFGIN